MLSGDVELVDSETGEVLELGANLATLATYKTRYAAWLDEQTATCTSRGVRYARLQQRSRCGVGHPERAATGPGGAVTFLLPVALVALIVAPLIYLVHLLRSSRRRVQVPALFLWADLPRTSSGKARRRWPPITLLLLLQLLAALLAGFALARPATSSEPPRHVALVLDASASMQATDVAPTRFDVARTRAGQRLAGLTPADQVSLIRAGSEAELLASGTPNSVRGALNAAQARRANRRRPRSAGAGVESGQLDTQTVADRSCW